ncbi:uncharacterized protein LOC133363348 [Rhineura floridana]|uniref:uncharacterized protein LOC133363348 n=1 Tax=Rhineura floridana TaxID=261503 RepID=UPI002AC7FCDC|nr:uncharacterized protein LOC133363348 [Rhineura floridana]
MTENLHEDSCTSALEARGRAPGFSCCHGNSALLASFAPQQAPGESLMALPRGSLPLNYSRSGHQSPSLVTTSTKQSTVSSTSPSPASPATNTKPPISSVVMLIGRVQARARANLLSAIASERAKRWREAIEYYRKLLHSLSRMKFPAEYVPGPNCTQLVFETYYHIGVAFQKIDLHHDASEEFTNAIEAASIPKSVCQVGCVSGSFYQTPVFARRAYAYLKCDKIKKAVCDATRAVHLDPLNPDVYCIRALVWSSAKEKRRALVDLNFSLRLNSSHICTLILRGAILKSIGRVSSSKKNKDHEKAFTLCCDSRHFFDVEDFYSPKMPSFYDKFLWSINAFHTITEINLFDGATFISSCKIKEQNMRGPFKCGTLTAYSDSTSLLRRKLYSRANESVTGINGNNYTDA